MGESGEAIFEEAVENRYTICRRCFRQSASKAERNSLSKGPSCGEGCGELSTTLEEAPISRGELEVRSLTLLDLIQEEGYAIDEEMYNDAIDQLAGVSEPPRTIFVDAIQAGLGEVSLSQLIDEYDLESENSQRTRSLVRELPSSNITEDQLEHIEEEVADQVTTVTSSHHIGSSVYYIPESERLPDEYQTYTSEYRSTRVVIETVIRKNESWFWEASAKQAGDWLEALDEELKRHAAPCLLSFIKSRQRYISRDSPSPEEQFRRTGLWAYHKEHAEHIMGFLRKQNAPQPLDAIAADVGLSEETTHTLLVVLGDTESVPSGTSNRLWKAV